MNETNKCILDSINIFVWSGFYDIDEVHQMIDEILEDEAEGRPDEMMLREAIQFEFDKKAAAELIWPEKTDCDRLDQLFGSLNKQGIIALQNAGYNYSAGIDDVAEILSLRGRDNVIGYCFYHEQDLERAITGNGLMIAFGDLDDDLEQRLEIGKIIARTTEEYEFPIEWNANPNVRINISSIDWKRRQSGDPNIPEWL